MAGKGVLERIFKVEPGITLGQWAYDRLANNWDKLIALFVGGGGMTYLAAITTWIKAWGPFGIGAAGLLSALIAWIGLSYAQSIRAKMHVRRAQADAIKKWETQVDKINPLAAEFHTKRISLLDLRDPVSPRIFKKRFIDCELIGPANVVAINSHLTGIEIANCDIAVVRQGVPITNAIALEECQMIGGKIINCTMFILSEEVPIFSAFGAKFITLTGVPALDTPPPPPAPLPPPIIAGGTPKT